MKGKQHFIDQNGDIVYTVNDTATTCEGCCYKDKHNSGNECNAPVPVEHLTTPELGFMFCIIKNKIYKRLV